MHVRHFKLLAKKLTAAAAAMAIGVTPPMLALCRCGATASADDCCSVSEKSCCDADQGELRCNCVCSATDDPTSEARGCSCSAAPLEFPVPTPGNPPRVFDADSGSLLLPSFAILVDSGLNGAAWSTAFDLEAPSGPLGLRLHAIFSVWRN